MAHFNRVNMMIEIKRNEYDLTQAKKSTKQPSPLHIANSMKSKCASNTSKRSGRM